MKARLFSTTTGYEMVNCEGRLYSITATGSEFITKDCGTVTEAWHGSGRLLRQIPNNLKKLFYKLNKSTNMKNTITVDAIGAFIEQFKPIINPHDPNSPHDGRMFETYGTEAEQVDATPDSRVFTLIDDGSGNEAIVAGKKWVNRLGYFITEVAHTGVEEFYLTEND